MGFRFFRHVHIASGTSVNVFGSGPSLSVGIRGAHVTIGRRGISRTVDVTGSGVFYTSRIGLHSGYHSAVDRAPSTVRTQQRTFGRFVEFVIGPVLFVLLVFLVLLIGLW
jgi:hypothetical protein